MRFVFFKDSKVFDKNNIWTMEQVIHKFPRTTAEIIYVDHIIVRASNGKELQIGLMIDANDKEEALHKYQRVRNS